MQSIGWASFSEFPPTTLNQLFYILINLLDPSIVNLSSQENFNSIFCLSDKHFQAVNADHAKFFCLSDKFCCERIVDNVQDGLTFWEFCEVNRGSIHFREHADRACVDDDFCVCVMRKTFIVGNCLAVIDYVYDDHRFGVVLADNGFDSLSSAAVSKNNYLFIR